MGIEAVRQLIANLNGCDHLAGVGQLGKATCHFPRDHALFFGGESCGRQFATAHPLSGLPRRKIAVAEYRRALELPTESLENSIRNSPLRLSHNAPPCRATTLWVALSIKLASASRGMSTARTAP